jgi:hypothetical protein
MACNMKTMMKLGIGIAVGALTAYMLFPQFREPIVALAPTLAFLICPLSMLLGMKMMSSQGSQSCQSSAKTAEERPEATAENEVKARPVN